MPIDKLMLAEMRKQTRALEVIAKSLAKLANPPIIAEPIEGDDYRHMMPGSGTYVERPQWKFF